MAHMRMRSGGGGGGGIESLTPPTGPISSAVSIGAFLALLVLLVKHPRVALNCALVGVALAVMSAGDGTGVSHNVVMFLLVIGVGCFLADGKSGWRKRPARPAPRAAAPLIKQEITTEHMRTYVTAKVQELTKENQR